MDRNIIVIMIRIGLGLSLSARRAWIEITQRRDFKRLGLVALRKESVDRNYLVTEKDIPELSLSARRAWIEIVLHGLQGLFVSGRSPQGERG